MAEQQTQPNNTSQDQGQKGRGKPAFQQQKKRRPPKSEYGRQLAEKQDTKSLYNLSEKQFANYVLKATDKKGVDPKAYLWDSLEKRLDTIVYRLGISDFSRKLSRQMIVHGHILVNGKRMDSPSYHVGEGDEISIRPQSMETTLVKNILEKLREEKTTAPSWLTFDYKKGVGKLKGEPDMKESGVTADFTSVIEFYSR